MGLTQVNKRLAGVLCVSAICEIGGYFGYSTMWNDPLLNILANTFWDTLSQSFAFGIESLSVCYGLDDVG